MPARLSSGALAAPLVSIGKRRQSDLVLERTISKEPWRHFDLYRIDDPGRLSNGFEEELDKRGVTVIDGLSDLEDFSRCTSVSRSTLKSWATSQAIVLRDFYQPSIVARCFGVERVPASH